MAEGESYQAPPIYNDAKDIERRAKLVAQSPLSVDKPAVAKGTKSKPMRFRNMRAKSHRTRKRNPNHPHPGATIRPVIQV